jgi:hypothetical protein
LPLGLELAGVIQQLLPQETLAGTETGKVK